MRTHNTPLCYRKSEIFIMPPGLALLSTLISSNYPCLEPILMVPEVLEPLKFYCTFLYREKNVCIFFLFYLIPVISNYWFLKANFLAQEILRYQNSEMNFDFEISRADCLLFKMLYQYWQV